VKIISTSGQDQPIEASRSWKLLTRTGNQVDAVVASNDGTAGGAIGPSAAAARGQGLVTGQTDLATCQRVVAGTQTMTV
jgi:D-xylose transport system substrate-binding protein